MGLYLYCIGAPDHPRPEAVEGVASAPVRALDSSGFRLWVSPMDRVPPPSMERLREHNAVLEAAIRSSTPLPMRYGQWFSDDAGLAASLERRRSDLNRSLDRVQGALEHGVRIFDAAAPEPAAPDRSSGRAYLEALARREAAAASDRRRGETIAAELRDHLGPLVRLGTVRPAGDRGLVAIAHLVDRHDTRAYSERLDAFPGRHPGLRFVRSGPWPPYGFVDEPELMT
jgi:hypothetical protein